jgi:hypothetical protein
LEKLGKGGLFMGLHYKTLLINELEHSFSSSSFFAEFWTKKGKEYCAQYGAFPETLVEVYNCLTAIKPENYSGWTLGRELVLNARYYMYDDIDDETAWFYTVEDAVAFAKQYQGDDSSILLETPDKNYFYNLFEDRRRKKFNGLYWLTAEDFLELDNILSMPPIIVCKEVNQRFFSEEEAVLWLVQTGKASNEKIAARQLHKCLSGETQRCYGYSWGKE